MPTPKPDEETMQEWMERCTSEMMDSGEADSTEQAEQICSVMWGEAAKSFKPDARVKRAYGVKLIPR